MPKRSSAIDILKASAIIAVILIHTTSIAFRFIKPENINYYLIFDQVLRFSVPLFVAISGFLLSAKYLNQKLEIKEFFQKRALKLLPSYLVWTGIIYFYLHYLSTEPQQQFSIYQIIFLGKADYHLYFVPMLFQLYLLFPIILYFYKRSKILTIIGTLAIQLVLIFFSLGIRAEIIKVNFPWGDQQQYLFSLSWIFYFTLGIFLFDYKSRIQKTRLKLALIALTFISFAATANQSISIFTKSHQLIDATTFTRFPIILFATSFVATALLFLEKLESLTPVVKKFIAEIGKSSYTIYLLHTIVIRLVYPQIEPVNFQKYLLFSIAVIFISITVSLIITKAVQLSTNLLPFSKKQLPR